MSCGEGTLSPDPSPSPTPSPAPTPTPTPAPTPRSISFSFQDDIVGWESGYSDYTEGQEEQIDFKSGHRDLPEPLAARSGFLLSSYNVADDVFMYITRPVEGLAPDTRYRVEIAVTFATNVPRGCAGIGGAPDAVYMKVGASDLAPANVAGEGAGYVSININKGDQAQSGTDVVAIGTVGKAAESTTCGDEPYELKSLATGDQDPIVTTDADGRLWLVIGTESGFEGETAIYILEGEVTLTPVDD
jgi:hypothetical protein